MKNKTIFSLAVIACFSLILFLCSPAKPNELYEGAISFGQVTSIEQVVRSANVIVDATMLSQRDYPGSVGQQIHFKVNETHKGSSEENIYVYADNSIIQMEENTDYILFLNKFDSEVYPHPVYSIIDYDSVFDTTFGFLSGKSKAGDSLIENHFTKSSMINYIKSIPEIHENVYLSSKVVDSFKNISDMYESSDKVALVEVTYYKNYHEYMSGIKVDNLINFKGEPLGTVGEFDIPAEIDISVGGKLILFLTESEEGPFFLSARNGAAISENSPEYQATLDYLENLK